MMKEENGTRDLNGRFTQHSNVLELVSEGATNVMLLVTAHPSEEATAWTAEVLTWFKEGHIPQIYMSWETSPKTTEAAISSNLRDTGKHLNGHFSVISRSSAKTKALILGSSSRTDDQ